jgi:hypothetical protein
MLADLTIDWVDNHFNIYDHEVRLYSEALGEPYLIDDVIAYFDGIGLYIRAFSLTDERSEIDASRMLSILKRSQSEMGGVRARFINIWGRFQHCRQIS